MPPGCLGQFCSRFIRMPLILLRVHSIRTSFISPLLNLLQSTKILVNHLVRAKGVRISEIRHDPKQPYYLKSSVHVNAPLILKVD